MTTAVQIEKKTISVVIVEDFKLTRVGLRCALNANEDINVVAESDNAIEGLELIGNIPSENYNVLIIDDICSRGGTFLHSAKKLKECGAWDIYLYVTHCENTILDGELINSGLIKKIFTTDSIYTSENENIEIIRTFR